MSISQLVCRHLPAVQVGAVYLSICSENIPLPNQSANGPSITQIHPFRDQIQDPVRSEIRSKIRSEIQSICVPALAGGAGLG